MVDAVSELEITNYKRQTTHYKLHTTNYKLHTSTRTQLQKQFVVNAVSEFNNDNKLQHTHYALQHATTTYTLQTSTLTK